MEIYPCFHYNEVMKKIFIMIIMAITLLGVELEFNKVYEGGLKLTANRLGVNFYLPLSWKGAVQNDQSFSMQHDEKLGYMTASRAKIDSVVSEMLQEYSFTEEIILKPVTKAKKLTRTLYKIDYRGRGLYRNYQGIGYIVVGPQNRVVKVMSIFKEKNITMMDNTVMRFVRSMSFTSI